MQFQNANLDELKLKEEWCTPQLIYPGNYNSGNNGGDTVFIVLDADSRVTVPAGATLYINGATLAWAFGTVTDSDHYTLFKRLTLLIDSDTTATRVSLPNCCTIRNNASASAPEVGYSGDTSTGGFEQGDLTVIN